MVVVGVVAVFAVGDVARDDAAGGRTERAVGVAEARVMNTAEIESAKLQAELAELKYQVAKQKSDEFHKKATLPAPDSQPLAPTPVLESPPGTAPQTDELYPKVYIDELRLTAASAKSAFKGSPSSATFGSAM